MPDPSGTRQRAVIQSRHGALVGLMAIVAAGMLLKSTRHPADQPFNYSLTINPNTANAGLLEALPRIGPTTAGRIIEEREIRPFRDLDDLDTRVKGVGPATRASIEPFLVFSQEPPVSSR